MSEYVTAIYKTGKYIGEVTGTHTNGFVVRILAVLRHPRQGDLHNPKEVDVQLFHERKALAYREQANIPEKMVKPYEGDVPEYFESLQRSFHELKCDLEKEDTPFAHKSLETLSSLKKEYELMYNITID